MRAAATRFDVPEHYTSAAEMIARADIELVLIATPIPSHYADAMRALSAGKHVYVQKTMTTTLAEAREVTEMARAGRRTLVASPDQMLCPENRRSCELVRGGAIGRVYWAFGTTAFSHEYEPL